MIKYIGIDTGLTGAICVLNRSGEIIEMHDMFVKEVLRGGKKKSVYAVEELIRWLQQQSPEDTFVMLEETFPRPKFMGGHSFANWCLGAGYFVWLGGLFFGKFSFKTCNPIVWQRTFFQKDKLLNTKQQAIKECRKRFKDFDKWFVSGVVSRGKNKGNQIVKDGRTDAALIAEYGRQQNQEK